MDTKMNMNDHRVTTLLISPAPMRDSELFRLISIAGELSGEYVPGGLCSNIDVILDSLPFN